jgi:hypothetical protein
MCSSRDLFLQTVPHKCGRDINCLLDCGSQVKIPSFRNSQTKIEANLGGFFHELKVRQPIGRQDSMQTVNRTIRRLDSFLHEAAENFELLSNIQDQK